jgi:hypothetical protein
MSFTFRLLAAMHFNNNSMHEQAVTDAGDLRWQVVTPKALKGAAVAKPVKEPSTKSQHFVSKQGTFLHALNQKKCKKKRKK